VTPAGVRDGDPDALADLCDVRGPAVLAYCEVVAGRGELGAAAAVEAFGSFRAGVVQAGDLATLNPESLLISATRHAAARHVSSAVPQACARVPGLLAARADRSISLADDDWLEQHLESCWTCRAPVARFNVADQAYREPPDTPLAPAVKAAMVAAMVAAAPVRVEAADVSAQSTNGNAAHAEPVAPQEPYVMPALGEQPTAFYELAPEDLAAPGDEPEQAERPRRRGTLLGKLGVGAAAAGSARAARPTAAPGSKRSASARGRRAERADPPDAPDPRAAGGAALPRPRRELERRPAGQRRERSALRPAIVLPVALVVIAIIAALAIAGVFGGGEPASVPQSFTPSASDAPKSTQAPKVVVVPGAVAASAAAVEKAKARARAARRNAAAATNGAQTAARPPAAAPPPAAAAKTTPPPPPPPPPPAARKPAATGKPKIDAGNGATGAEQLPPAKDTSTVPDLAPPVETAPPPP
jgi:hypothetical protein